MTVGTTATGSVDPLMDVLELQEEHGFDLFRAYRESTRPCLVKFVDNKTSPRHIGAALQHLYCHLHAVQFSDDREIAFNASGKAIPPDRILKVVFLDTT